MGERCVFKVLAQKFTFGTYAEMTAHVTAALHREHPLHQLISWGFKTDSAARGLITDSELPLKALKVYILRTVSRRKHRPLSLYAIIRVPPSPPCSPRPPGCSPSIHLVSFRLLGQPRCPREEEGPPTR